MAVLIVYKGIVWSTGEGGAGAGGVLVYGRSLQKFSLKVKVIKAVRLAQHEDTDATTTPSDRCPAAVST